MAGVGKARYDHALCMPSATNSSIKTETTQPNAADMVVAVSELIFFRLPSLLGTLLRSLTVHSFAPGGKDQLEA